MATSTTAPDAQGAPSATPSRRAADPLRTAISIHPSESTSASASPAGASP